MSILDNFKEALGRCTNPNKNTGKMEVMDALKYYYRVMILPMIVSVVLALIFGIFVGSALGGVGSIFGGVVTAVIAVVYFIVLIPIGLLFSAAVLQLFAKMVFGIYKGNYSRTFTAVMFGALPVILFYWLGFIPVLGMLLLVFGLWSIYTTVVSLSKQHNISLGKAFLGWIITAVILAVIEIVLVVVGLQAFGLGNLLHL